MSMGKEKRLNTALHLSAEAKPRILFERSGCGNEPLSSPVRFDYKLAKLRRVPEKTHDRLRIIALLRVIRGFVKSILA